MWYEILVCVLAGLLAIFLLLSVIVLIKIVQIVKTVKRIIERAEQMADKAEHIAEFFEKTATPVALVKLVSNISDTLINKRKK